MLCHYFLAICGNDKLILVTNVGLECKLKMFNEQTESKLTHKNTSQLQHSITVGNGMK